MSEAVVCGVAVAMFFLGYVCGHRAGLKAAPPPRVVSLRAKRKGPLRMTKRGPRG